MGQALINADMLSWARKRAGLSVSVLAEKLQQPEEKVAACCLGSGRDPTDLPPGAAVCSASARSFRLPVPAPAPRG